MNENAVSVSYIIWRLQFLGYQYLSGLFTLDSPNYTLLLVSVFLNSM